MADDEVMLDRDEVKLAVERATIEYLKSGEVDEVVRRLHAIRNTNNAIEAVKVIIYRAIDAADPEREMLAGLLSSLRVRGIVSFKSIEAALQILFARVHDMKLDQPRLEEKFAALLTFLVQDDTISEGFLNKSNTLDFPNDYDGIDRSARGEILKEIKANALATLNSRIPTALLQLRSIYRDIVDRYLAHGDMDQLYDDLAVLHAPHTYHELVRKAVQLSLALPDFSKEAASDLLQQLHEHGTLSSSTVQEGFLRLLRGINELLLDEPAASTTIAKFIARAVADNVLGYDFCDIIVPTSPAGIVTASGEASTPMNSLARCSAERSRDGWTSSVPTSPANSPVLARSSSLLADRHAVEDVLEALHTYLPSGPIDDATRSRLRSIWGFRRPLAELRAAIGAMVLGYCAAEDEELASETLATGISLFECSELLPDLVFQLVVSVARKPMLLTRLRRDIVVCCQRRALKPHALMRGLVQVIENLLKYRRDHICDLQDVFLSVLVGLTQAGCLNRSFFVEIAPSVGEYGDDDASDTSAGPRTSLEELRLSYIAALDE